MTADKLWDDYLYWRRYTAKANQTNQPHATVERLAAIDSMISWCTSRSIDPRSWLYSLFAARRWLLPPRLKRCDLESEKHLKRRFRG